MSGDELSYDTETHLFEIVSSSGIKDPWNWSSRDFRRFSSKAKDLFMQEFWMALADNHCDGQLYLTVLDASMLKHYFNVTEMQHAAVILARVAQIRSMSPQYLQWSSSLQEPRFSQDTLIRRFETSGMAPEGNLERSCDLFALNDNSLSLSKNTDQNEKNSPINLQSVDDTQRGPMINTDLHLDAQKPIKAPLLFKDYLYSSEDTTNSQVCQIVLPSKAPHYILERSYIQRHLRYAFMQSYEFQNAKQAKQSRTLWKLHRGSTNDAYLKLIAEGVEAPYIGWIKDASTSSLHESDIQWTDWFERIDWEARLARYATEDDGEVLPPFGDSDEDEEYESDVLNEMFQEEQEVIEANYRPEASCVLSHYEVLSIIEQHKEQMQDEWRSRFLPKRQQSQAMVYLEHHKKPRSIKSEELQSLTCHREQLLSRQTKLVDSIAEQVYHSERAIRLQSTILRETVYQLEENAFVLALFQGNTPVLNSDTDESSSGAMPEIMSVISGDSHQTRGELHESYYQDQEDSALSNLSESEYIYEDMTQNILEIDDDGVSVVTIDSSQPDSDNLFSSQSSIRKRANSRYPAPPTSNIREEPIILSSDLESEEPQAGIQAVAEAIIPRRQHTVALAVPRQKLQPNHVQKRSRLLEHLRRPLDHLGGMKFASGEREKSVGQEELGEHTSSKIIFASKDEEDHVETFNMPIDVAMRDSNNQIVPAEAQTDTRNDEDNPDEASAASDQETIPAMTKTTRSKKRKKKKVKKFDSESEELEGIFKRKRPKRAINEHAFARRRAQHKEREAIKKRAEQQITTNVVRGNSTITINPGDSQEEENSILISPKVAHLLKAHQIDGVRFLWRETVMMSSVNGCLLAHSMGLGKTLQVIAYLETLGHIIETSKNSLPKELRRPHAMILCPASLARNWVDEFRKWVPECSMGEVSDMSEENENSERIKKLKHWKKRGGVIIITYTVFSQMIHNQTSYGQMFDGPEAEEVRSLLGSVARVVVADEAHLFKNEKTKLGVAVRCIEARARIVLTGSPLANNLMEYWAIMDWLDPDFFGSKNDFRTEHLLTIEAGNRHDASKADIRQGQKQLKVLLGIIGGKIDRRNMDSLQALLPSKFEYVLFIKFTPVQRQLYNSFIEMTESARGARRQFEFLLILIAKLKLICNHPALIGAQFFDYKEDKARQRKNKDIPEVDHQSDPDCRTDVNANESFGQLVQNWRDHILNDETIDFEGPGKSAKVKILLEILKGAKSRGDKVLVFSFSRPTIGYLENIIKDHALGPLRVITGALPAALRVEAVKEFNNLSGYAVCLISTKAGGQGLNMTGANRVVLFDHDFNPSWAEQAVGRAYRMGQTKDVHVYRLQIDGSFEIKLFQQALTKLGLTSRVVDKKNIQTKLRPEETLREYFKKAPKIDRQPDKIEQTEDQLLSAVIAVCKDDILSVEKTGNYHIDEANELDDTDLLDIKAKQEAFWREREKRMHDMKAAQHASTYDTSTSQAEQAVTSNTVELPE